MLRQFGPVMTRGLFKEWQWLSCEKGITSLMVVKWLSSVSSWVITPYDCEITPLVMYLFPHHLVTLSILTILLQPALSEPTAPSILTLPTFYTSTPPSPSPSTNSSHLLLSRITAPPPYNPVTDPWPMDIPNMGKGVNITIPENYSKHCLPSGALTQVNIGKELGWSL